MEPSADEKSPPSSRKDSKASPSTPKPTGAKPNIWRARIQTAYRQWTWPAYRQLLRQSKRPIFVGPFLGEVGLEALYWQPFVDAVRESCAIDSQRLIPLTRSGSHVWYNMPLAVEIYGMRTPQEVRIENRLRVGRTGLLKQMGVSDFDRGLYADAAQTLGHKQYLTLHPAWMFQTVQPFWNGQRGLSWLEPRLRFAPLPMPQLPIELPPQYVAVSFYARATWPPTSITAGIARETITKIASQVPVVILTSGLHMDDHADYIPRPLPENVILLSDRTTITPETSLMIYSAVMAKAVGFVGTYGGLSHLALRYKVPSVNLFADWGGVLLAHRQLSEALALQMRVPYHVLRLNDIPILQDVLPKVLLQGAGSSSGARQQTAENPVASEPQMV